MVTAKVKLTSKQFYGEGPEATVTMRFNADYADGRNKEWAANTPSLSLEMTVKGTIAEKFSTGTPYTLTFEPDVG